MPAANGYILRLSPSRLQTLREAQDLRSSFIEPVPEFEHSRNVPLVCFVTNQQGLMSHIGSGSRGIWAATDLRRLNVQNLVGLREPIRLSDYTSRVPSRLRPHLVSRIQHGGLLSQKGFRALSNVLAEVNEELSGLLTRFTSTRDARIRAIPERVLEQLAFQQEAVATALSVAGLDRAPVTQWNPPVAGTPRSFLDGLPQARVREDVVVMNDWARVPGYQSLGQYIHGTAVFESDDGTRLTVLMANRQRLEELTGADLIYYNETFRSFVMVQYKMMDPLDAGGSIFRLPNAQLDLEISRMEDLCRAIEGECTPDHPDAYRLMWNPFFLKLCPRIVFNPDSQGISPGMYIPLDKWKLLVSSGTLTGPGDGLGATYDNILRKFDNTGFLSLISNAWIGTTPAQSNVIEAAIRETVESGKTAVVAIRTHRDNKPVQRRRTG